MPGIDDAKFLEKEIEAAKKYIADKEWIAKDIGYDWLNVCVALSESFTDVNGAFLLPPESEKDMEKIYRRKVAAGELPQKDPATGDWDHVIYVPRWTDPDYDPKLIVSMDGVITHRNTVHDAIHNLRPALRIEDQIWNPTPYALRFGIADGRRDGRSRMSPPWSTTRDPFDDHANQVDMLSAAEHAEAARLTREAHQAAGTVPPPGETVSRLVMQRLLTQYNLLSNEQLKDMIKGSVDMGTSFDELVHQLEEQNPGVTRAHRVFLQNVQSDQNYQRLLWDTFTTDEVVGADCHAITDDDDLVMELDNDVHPLLARERWESAAWAGTHNYSPKQLYSLNGSTRESWDVATNDALWEAMLPSLRLVTMILESEHPHIEAIFDMTTRSPLAEPDEQDPALATYTLQENKEEYDWFPKIQAIDDQWGYDWKANVLRILDKYLVLEVAAFYGATGRYAEASKKIEEQHAWSFVTDTVRNKNAKKKGIIMSIAAEALWPLLVPQYSRAEKLVSAWNLATSIIHEFAHAIHFAQVWLMEFDWADDPDQPEGLGAALRAAGKDVAGKDNGVIESEPYFMGKNYMELGIDLEEALWGFYPSCAMHNVGAGNLVAAEGLHTLPWPVYAFRFGGSDWYGANTAGYSTRAAAGRSGVYSLSTVPLEFFAKLFRKRFWKREFAAYGHVALRIMPESPAPMITTPSQNPDLALKSAYLPSEIAFLSTAWLLFGHNRQSILARYIRALAVESMRGHKVKSDWRTEVEIYWPKEQYYPLERCVSDLEDQLRSCKRLCDDVWDPNQEAAYQRYWHDNAQPNQPPPKSLEEWQSDMYDEWDEAHRLGGLLMQQLLLSCDALDAEIGLLQLMLFQLLTLEPSDRFDVFDRSSEFAVDNISLRGHLIDRLQTYGTVVMDTGNWLSELITLPELAKIPRRLSEYKAWIKRYRELENNYLKLLTIASEDADQFEGNPKDIAWKGRFNRVPTFFWRSEAEQFEELARREYRRADPAIQKLVDDCIHAIQSATLHIKSRLAAEPNGGPAAITDASRSLSISGASTGGTRRPASRSPSLFDFRPPSRRYLSRHVFPTRRSARFRARAPQQPPDREYRNNNSPHQFGVPTPLDLNELPARRSVPAVVAGARSGVRKTRKATANAPFLQYLSRGGEAKAMDLFRVGLPQPIVDAFLPAEQQRQRQQPLPPPPPPPPQGGMQQQQQQQQQFTPGAGFGVGMAEGEEQEQRVPIVPFPEPYANRVVLSSELAAFREQQALTRHANGQQRDAAGTYRTARMWREKKRSGSLNASAQ
ncbi:hypothetical protein F5Y17DRAFT_429210 [Xylariaceae sp. FL0594]|nr:hypothetical protein F5Y17DRAFT_429210 [Xylariaceae sp. FL0594]